MRTKHATMRIKAPDAGTDGDLKTGQFEGYASVFGNVDSYGDRVLPGAFTKTLEDYGDDGAGIPCYWMHRLDDPELNLGSTVKAWEDEKGLRVRVQLDLDNPKAAHVHKLIKTGRVREMSFAYEVTDGEETDDAFEIKEVDLFEVSIVPVGANRETELLGVKAREIAKALQGEETEETAPDAGKAPGEPPTPEGLLNRLKNLADALDEIISDLKDTGEEETNEDDSTGDEDPREEPGGQPGSKSLTLATAMLALTRGRH